MLKNKRGSIETYRLIKSLNKQEILRLSKLTCNCGHSYLAHPHCAIKENIIVETAEGKYKLKEKIGFLDIETFIFNFRADMGITLCYTIKELDGKMKTNVITPKECALPDKNDKRLITDVIKDMKGYTRLIGHNVGYFDFPFLRTRATYYGLDFPIYQEIYQTDTWQILKHKFSLKSNSLRNGCQFFGIPCKEHAFNFDIWYRAAKGSIKDLKHVVVHCEEDVVATEALWKKINSYVAQTKKSI